MTNIIPVRADQTLASGPYLRVRSKPGPRARKISLADGREVHISDYEWTQAKTRDIETIYVVVD